jgi:hypothetical protein
VDQEAEAEMVQSETLQVGAEGVAGAKPAADPGDDLGPRAVVTDEGDVAGLLPSRLGLAEVVEQRPEPQGLGAGELVGEGLGQEGVDLLRELGAKPGRSDSIRAIPRARRALWPWTSRWWLGFWTTPRVASSSQHDCGQLESVQQLEGAKRGRPPSMPGARRTGARRPPR